MTKQRRAASGESSIHKDAAGRWHGYVSMGLRPDGKRDRRHVSGTTRAAVVAKVRELEQKRDAGLADPTQTNMSVSEWLDHWLENVAVRKVRTDVGELRVHRPATPEAGPGSSPVAAIAT